MKNKQVGVQCVSKSTEIEKKIRAGMSTVCLWVACSLDNERVKI